MLHILRAVKTAQARADKQAAYVHMQQSGIQYK